ncbi:patatin-like phospholipase domain-containing protein 2 isoform X2 [Plectropomus leopardus]|uniref:patatin-like phospholipase domain-containing protein 2 isoform X2 n=1 Tax=Plectropomus leopardus TaxID=160734 RepID=UPI001C4A9DAD|nr:patatin-like phospholipase domain-containing protein 2 isoform X2 [Plectropomus leopardus]
METSEKMSNWDKEWNISFAGCGFRSIYYLGALSCILERVPWLVHGAAKIGGASSGCLVAAALTVGIPIEQFCVDVLAVAKEARKHTLGVFHPTFSLLRTVQDSLLEKLPADAHIRASGRLCVSLTRLADGKNVLVSEFDSREELIQVLMCSCFFPIYCGFSPPSYRGVLYMDGALSNNMPLFEHRNTITMAPFSGESDICPREGTFNFLEVHYGNVSIKVNTSNVHRVCTSFLPPRLEELAEICHNGYMDALRFLRERDLLGPQCLSSSVMAETDAVKPACCETRREVAQAEESRKTLLNGHNRHQEDHWWLSLKVIENLPVSFKKVLCEACRDSHSGDTRWSQLTEFLPVKVVLCLLTLVMLPIELSFILIKSMILSMLKLTADLCRRTWSSRDEDSNSTFSEEHSSSSSDLRSQTRGDKNIQPLTSTVPPISNKILHWDNNGNLELSLASTFSVPSSFSASSKPAYSKVTLNHRGCLLLQSLGPSNQG